MTQTRDRSRSPKKFDAAAALHNTSKDHDGAVNLYDKWADTYDDSLSSWGYEAPERIADLLWKNIGKEGSKKVMDCGCGTGMSGEAILRAGDAGSKLFLVGTDCSPGSLKLTAEKKLTKEAEKKVYQQTTVVNLELKQEMFEDGTFDGITCVGTTSYLHDFDMIFGEWCRMSKKGGFIIFTHRTNIWDSDEHKVQSTAKKFEETKRWKLVSTSEKCPYMPKNPVVEEAEKTIYYKVYQVL